MEWNGHWVRVSAPAAPRVAVRILFSLSCLFLPPQLDPPDLPADRLGQLVDKLDLARILVGRGDSLAMLLQLGHEMRARRRIRPQLHESLHDRAAVGVWTRNHRRFHYRRMLEQGALHLERADSIASRNDHVVGASDEP